MGNRKQANTVWPERSIFQAPYIKFGWPFGRKKTTRKSRDPTKQGPDIDPSFNDYI